VPGRVANPGVPEGYHAMKLRMPGGKNARPIQPELDIEPEEPQSLWLEEYANYTRQAKTWRLIAMIEAVILIAGVAGLIYFATTTQFAPYIVSTGADGAAVTAQLAEQAVPVTEKVIHAELADWTNDARSVVADSVVQRTRIAGVYALVQNGSQARQTINGYYAGADTSPLLRAAKETDSVNVDAVLPLGNQSYVVQWTETKRDLGGKVTGTQHWESSVTIVFSTPTSQDELLRNPLGLYITQLTWTQKG
jgi:type IV secretory pathway TrbF-like protein